MLSNVFRCSVTDIFEEHLSSMRFRSLCFDGLHKNPYKFDLITSGERGINGRDWISYPISVQNVSCSTIQFKT